VDKKPSHEDIDKIFFDIINPKQLEQQPSPQSLRPQTNLRQALGRRRPEALPSTQIPNVKRNGVDTDSGTANRNQLSQ